MDVVYYNSPVGPIEISGSGGTLRSLSFVSEVRSDTPHPDESLKACVRQLDAYFSGTRTRFSVPLFPEGTDFQQRVWKELRQIPFGRTVAYGDIARAIGAPAACRAVGAANKRNPIPILIPCHRVIGADGRLTGYSSGLWRKVWFLKHEGFRIAGNRVIA